MEWSVSLGVAMAHITVMVKKSDLMPCHARPCRRGPFPWSREVLVHATEDGKMTIQEIPE